MKLWRIKFRSLTEALHHKSIHIYIYITWGSDTRRGNSAYKRQVYIYRLYIYIYNKIVIKAVQPAKYILKQV